MAKLPVVFVGSASVVVGLVPERDEAAFVACDSGVDPDDYKRDRSVNKTQINKQKFKNESANESNRMSHSSTVNWAMTKVAYVVHLWVHHRIAVHWHVWGRYKISLICVLLLPHILLVLHLLRGHWHLILIHLMSLLHHLH